MDNEITTKQERKKGKNTERKEKHGENVDKGIIYVIGLSMI